MLHLRIAFIISLSTTIAALSFDRENRQHDPLENDANAGLIHRQRRNIPQFDDPDFPKAFYLNDEFGVTMNIIKAWNAKYTGKNVTICVSDPMGLNWQNRELASNYVSQASYDFKDNDTDPSPDTSNSHGTEMAGLAAAKSNNGLCSGGVAYDASVSGVKFSPTGPTEEYGIRSSFAFKNNLNDIYLCSWGPGDLIGMRIGYMYPSIAPAIKNAAEQGRNGKGNLILFSTGNGGQFNNSCSYDEYISSIYTIGISVVTGKNIGSRQNVKCSGISAVTYSRDGSLGVNNPNDLMPCPGLGDTCKKTSGSSSAANAVAAGIMALVLSANPNLGWRDVQHLIARSSCSRFDTIQWKTNKAGLKVSDEFGFGLLDAYALIDNAKTWTNVEGQLECKLSYNSAEPIHGVNTLTKTVDMTTWPAACGGESNRINYLEHVVLVISLNFTLRKNLEIQLEAPTNTKSVMLRSDRVYDTGMAITNLPILSLHNWGEDPKGLWTMKLRNVRPDITSKGTLYNWTLKFYGTKSDPMASNSVKPSMIRANGTAASSTSAPTNVSSTVKPTGAALRSRSSIGVLMCVFQAMFVMSSLWN